jgi:hypothetical protein
MVVSHDCEWTKWQQYGEPYHFLVAPLRKLSAFDDEKGFHGHARSNRVRFLFPLPTEGPLDDEYVVELRAIQPILVSELLEHEPWTCIGPPLKDALMGKLLIFFTGRLLRAATT